MGEWRLLGWALQSVFGSPSCRLISSAPNDRCPGMLKIQAIIDDAKCYEVIRSLRWPDGVRCPHCDSGQVIKQGRDPTQPERRHYECRGCHRRFDDLTGTT